MGGGKGVAECKPPFWRMGAGGIVNGSAVYRPSFEMLGGGGLMNGLVLLLGMSVGAMRSPLLDFQLKSSFWRTGGVGIIQEVSFSGIVDVAEG